MKISQRTRDRVWARQRGGCACCTDAVAKYLSTNEDRPTETSVVGLCPNCFNEAGADGETAAQIAEYVEYLSDPAAYLRTLEVMR